LADASQRASNLHKLAAIDAGNRKFCGLKIYDQQIRERVTSSPSRIRDAKVPHHIEEIATDAFFVSKVEIRPSMNQLEVKILNEIVGFVAPPLGDLAGSFYKPRLVPQKEVLTGRGFREWSPQDHADQFLLVLRSTPLQGRACLDQTEARRDKSESEVTQNRRRSSLFKARDALISRWEAYAACECSRIYTPAIRSISSLAPGCEIPGRLCTRFLIVGAGIGAKLRKI
jgi:hypothetical protein